MQPSTNNPRPSRAGIEPSGPAMGGGAKKLTATVGVSAAAMLVAFVGQWEGKRNDPYRDIVGVMTVCYGETRVAMRRYSDAECNDMLAKGLSEFAAPVLARNPELKGHDAQLVAATSLAYNVGAANYRKSNAAKLFSARRWKEACNAFLAWRFAGGKEVKGLLRRRQDERALCLRGL